MPTLNCAKRAALYRLSIYLNSIISTDSAIKESRNNLMIIDRPKAIYRSSNHDTVIMNITDNAANIMWRYLPRMLQAHRFQVLVFSLQVFLVVWLLLRGLFYSSEQ